MNDFRAVNPDFHPVNPDFRPVIPDFHPVIPDFHPVIPDFHPVIPDFHPVIPDFHPVIPDFHLVIPAKAGIQKVANAVSAARAPMSAPPLGYKARAGSGFRYLPAEFLSQVNPEPHNLLNRARRVLVCCAIGNAARQLRRRHDKRLVLVAPVHVDFIFVRHPGINPFRFRCA